MSSTIRSTIESAAGHIPSGYQHVLDSVVEAVEGLAEQAAESLRESGRALGASSDQIEAALQSAGLVEEEAVPEPADDTSGLSARLAEVERQVQRLVQAAQDRFGFRV